MLLYSVPTFLLKKGKILKKAHSIYNVWYAHKVYHYPPESPGASCPYYPHPIAALKGDIALILAKHVRHSLEMCVKDVQNLHLSMPPLSAPPLSTPSQVTYKESSQDGAAAFTKKKRFIERMTSLSPETKEKVIAFFSKYPVYESLVDWNKKNLVFQDFDAAFRTSTFSRRNIKEIAKEQPAILFHDYNCKIIAETKEFLIVVPLNWECARFFNSFQCGGEGTRWCIGDKETEEHWNRYISNGVTFAMVHFTGRNPLLGKKVMATISHSVFHHVSWGGIEISTELASLHTQQDRRLSLSLLAPLFARHYAQMYEHAIKPRRIFSQWELRAACGGKYYSARECCQLWEERPKKFAEMLDKEALLRLLIYAAKYPFGKPALSSESEPVQITEPLEMSSRQAELFDMLDISDGGNV